MKNNQIALMGDNGEKICFSTISAEMEKIVENIDVLRLLCVEIVLGQ